MAEKAEKTGQDANCIYVICGKDKHRVSNECGKLVDGLLSPDERAMSLFAPEVAKVEITEVLDELRTLPFIAARRVVVLKGADKFISENRDLLEKYFDEPSRTGVLILTVDTWRKNTKLAKKLVKVGQLIEIAELKGWQLPKYVAEYGQGIGKGFARGAAEMVVEGEFARFELGQVTNEELLRAQDLLAGARQNNISAIIKYNIALSELARAQGVLGHGLSIEGIETR